MIQEMKEIRASTPYKPENLGLDPVPGSQNTTVNSPIRHLPKDDTGMKARKTLIVNSIEDLLEQVSNYTSIKIDDDMSDTYYLSAMLRKLHHLRVILHKTINL